jgi:hypothetical protein
MGFLEQYTFIPLLRELKIARRGHECPSLDAIMSQFNAIHSFMAYFCKPTSNFFRDFFT